MLSTPRHLKVRGRDKTEVHKRGRDKMEVHKRGRDGGFIRKDAHGYTTGYINNSSVDSKG